ncbi:MAG TPA: hypothetical protein VKQ27_08185, partial [Acetobacteraceae bacterium]|nr:hypothetical protein [Acetobacteraceae bacterium]
LYVEDLHGGGHHSDIYTTTVPKGKGATTLWPMGWHQGRLVLSVWTACTFEPLQSPNAWHVVDAATGIRTASIGDANCIPGAWPSPAGIACAVVNPGQINSQVNVYDWNGALINSVRTQSGANELSPSGDLLSIGYLFGPGSPSTTIIKISDGTAVTVSGHLACQWIDDSHVLAGDAVIAYPSGSVAPIGHGGVCAGRFPGSL